MSNLVPAIETGVFVYMRTAKEKRFRKYIVVSSIHNFDFEGGLSVELEPCDPRSKNGKVEIEFTTTKAPSEEIK